MLVLDTHFTVTMPQGTISDMGKTLISRYISQQFLSEGAWKDLNPDTSERYIKPLPDDWSWVWTVTGKAAYVGTFPKRVSKFYHVEQKLKCPPEFITELGNIARSHSSEAITYKFDIVDSIDWHAGDYGDGGSCYWRSRRAAKKILTDNGGLAIRFFEDNRGKGRAWIAPYEGMYIVFNGYGFSGDSTLTIARVLAQFLGCSYKKIGLENQGSTTGILYINNGGYLIGQTDEIIDIDDIELEYDGEYTLCDRCGGYMDEDDYNTAPNGDMYCQDCYNDNCGYCHHCEETHWTSDLTYIEAGDGDYCDHCLNEQFTCCEGCDEYHTPDDITIVSDEAYCETCLEERFEHCESCEEWKDKEGFKEIDDKRLCEECSKTE